MNVRDGAGALVSTQPNVVVPSSATSHLHVGFTPPIQGLALTIELVLPATGLNFVAIDNVTFGEFAPSGVGQPNTALAALRVNGVGTTDLQGPFAASMLTGGTLSLSWNGPPGAALLLASGPLHPAGTLVPCVGSIDIGTPPGYADLVILVDGNQPTFPDAFFHVTSAGTAEQTFTIPFPMVITLQGAVFQGPCGVKLTAAFTLTVL